MRHLGDGTLRRLLDEPLAIADSERRHLDGCAACQDRYDEIAAKAREAQIALAVPHFAPKTDAALSVVQQRLAGAPRVAGPSLRPRAGRRFRLPRLVPAVAAAAALVGAIALTPAGSVAQSFITVFQPTAVTGVQLTSLDIKSLAQLREYGTYQVPASVPSSTVSSAAAASAKSGMTVLVPSSLPAGVPNSVTYTVSPGDTASFTFDAARAQAAAAAAGETLPAMPADVDGSTLQVTVGSTVVATYGSCGTTCSDIPPLVIGQMVAPRVTSTKANLKEMEDYVLSLPGLSPGLAAQIRAMGDPDSTLPIPVPAGLAHADPVTVQGMQGLGIGDQTGVGSVVVWEKDGIIYGVGGPMAESQVVSIADSLR